MKKHLAIGDLVQKVEDKQKTFSDRLDRLGFVHILLIWTSVVVLFGILYVVLAGKQRTLYSPVWQNNITNIWDALYFSFITATTTGFGDIVPTGAFRVVSVVEVVFGLLLLAFVTSKLVSIKQNSILSEIYEISFNERMTRLRSSLLLFRQNLDRLIIRIEEGGVKGREIRELYMHFNLLEDTLIQIEVLFSRTRKTWTKGIDAINSQLIFNSVDNSFHKVAELLKVCNGAKLKWKQDVNLQIIRSCMEKYESIWELLRSGYLTEKGSRDAREHRKETIDGLIRILGKNEGSANPKQVH